MRKVTQSINLNHGMQIRFFDSQWIKIAFLLDWLKSKSFGVDRGIDRDEGKY